MSDWENLIVAPPVVPQSGKKKVQPGPRKWPNARWAGKAAAPAAVEERRRELRRRAFDGMSFANKVWVCERAENVERLGDPTDPLRAGVWDRVRRHLGTSSRTLPDLIGELGVARFGHRPIVCDPFSGGGSIPFEAARIGCGVVASDLNPVACMLTWGAVNVVGAPQSARDDLRREQRRVADLFDLKMVATGFEHDADGNRAKAYLYCSEAVDPQTGWLVPLLPKMVVSESRRIIIRLEPDYQTKRLEIRLHEVSTPGEMNSAKAKGSGTLRDGNLVYRLSPEPGGEEREWSVPVSRLRGDRDGVKDRVGVAGNRLRAWTIDDIVPRRPRWDPGLPGASGFPSGAWTGGDIFLERLYAVQWIEAAGIAAGKKRPDTFFTAATAADEQRELDVERFVRLNLAKWQEHGWVPSSIIETGVETARLLKERGWTHWHHFFFPRQLLMFAALREIGLAPELMNCMAMALDYNNRAAEWQSHLNTVSHLFTNQALNVLWDPAARASVMLRENLLGEYSHFPLDAPVEIDCAPVAALKRPFDIAVFDPPYADAVHYHEITEFFIGWFRRSPPKPFAPWAWDSRRPLAIQGKGEKFRSDMVAAFQTLTALMPSNGMQVCMFTHKDAGVWAEMAGIVWASGLRVTAAWYVSTETTSELKQGGYVQGTVLLVLRKRAGDEHGFRSDIVPEVRTRVAQQVETLTGLNQRAKGNGRDESLFSDADIQMAGYAAALEVLTSYTHIDGVDMTREALRPRPAIRRGQPVQVGIVEEMIDLAVQTANERMLPDGFTEGVWERLGSAERFYLKMTAAEAAWPAGAVGGKLDDYQNFAKAYRAEGWEDLMADRQPNRARLKTAAEFRAAYLNGHALSGGSLRPTLYAVMCLHRDAEAEAEAESSGKQALHGLRDHFGDAEWLRERDNVRTLAAWLGRTWGRRNPGEATAARVLASLVQSERL